MNKETNGTSHMKNGLIFMLGWLIFSLAFTRLSAQVVSPASPTDTLYVVPLAGNTLPTIKMKSETLFIIPFLVIPVTALFLGGHSYQINEKRVFSPTRLKPYFLFSGDEIVLKHYRTHIENRKIWYAATTTGTVVWMIGFGQLINSLFDSSAGGGAGALIILGSAGIIGGQIARNISFQNLRKAVNLYNYRYAGKYPTVSLHLGLPSATPAGLALHLKF